MTYLPFCCQILLTVILVSGRSADLQLLGQYCCDAALQKDFMRHGGIWQKDDLFQVEGQHSKRAEEKNANWGRQNVTSFWAYTRLCDLV